MNPKPIIDRLENNLDVFRSLLDIRDKDQIHWKPDPSKWCPLEVICHLIDEEKEDFRNRVKTTLEKPGEEPTPIDPVGWVKSRNYIGQDFESKKEEFFRERKMSIDYLKSLDAPNWKNLYVHQSLGELSAELFLNNWLAHDLLHIKQLTKLHYDYLSRNSGIGLDYAGKWP